MPAYYPAFLNLHDQPCLVVGGGSVAARKVRSLLEAGASVRVVSPDLSPDLQELSEARTIAWDRRSFRAGDCAGVLLVIAATNDRAANEAVSAAARDAGCLVNVVDTPDLCTFIVPSVVQRGALTIAISTGGQSPALAKSIRQEIEALLPAGIADHLEVLAELRVFVRQRIATPAEREAIWRDIMAAGLLACLQSGDSAGARALVETAVAAETGLSPRGVSEQ